MEKTDIRDIFHKHQQTVTETQRRRKPTKKPTIKHTNKVKDPPALESVLASNQQHEFVYFLYAVRQHRKGQWVFREPDYTVVLQAPTSCDEVLKALDKLATDFYK